MYYVSNSLYSVFNSVLLIIHILVLNYSTVLTKRKTQVYFTRLPSGRTNFFLLLLQIIETVSTQISQ